MIVCEVYCCFVPWGKGTLNMYMVKFFLISNALYIRGHITQCILEWGHQRLLISLILFTQSADHYNCNLCEMPMRKSTTIVHLEINYS